MRLLRSFPLAALGLIVLAIVTFCAAKSLVTLLLITGAAAAASWYLTEGPRGIHLPRPLSHVLMLLASAGALIDVSAHPDDPIGVLGRFTIWIALIKVYERKTAADWAQLMWLSLVLVIAAVLASRDLLVGAALLLYSALGVHVLVLFQLHAGHERARRARRAEAPAEARLVPVVQPVLGARVAMQFAITVASIGLAGVVIGAFVFVSYPRDVGAGMFRTMFAPPKPNPSSVPNEVSLTAGSRITDSRAPVMQVRLLDQAGSPIEFPRPIYLRGKALDAYDEQTFTWKAPEWREEAIREATSGPVGFTWLAAFEPETSALLEAQVYTLELSPLTALGPTIYSMATTMAVSTSTDERVLYDQRTRMLSVDSERIGAYRVQSTPAPSRNALIALSGGSASFVGTSQRYLDPRVRDLAARLVREAGLPPRAPGNFPERGRYFIRAAAIFEEYLRANHRYTLDLSDVEIAGDPIVGFLFDFRRGHCEYFASAMTAMCQALDIEARLIIGFQASEYEGDGYYMVRENHAHAWVEVRAGLFDWQEFDPTPPSALEELNAPANEGVAGRVYEFFEVGWIENIVQFDGSSQAAVQATLHLDSLVWLDNLVRSGGQWLRTFIRRFGLAGILQIAAIAAAGLVGLAIVVRLLRRARRFRRALHLEHLHRWEARRLLRQLGFYLDLLDVLRRGGLEKPRWQPPLAFAEVVRALRADIAPHMRDLTTRFYAVRYGERPITPEQVDEARGTVKAMATALGVRV